MDRLISEKYLLNAFGLSEKTRKWGGDHSGYNTMMLYEIQDVIESAPLVNPQHSGDLISRQDAIKAIDEKAKRIKNEDTLNGLAGAVNVLYELSPVSSLGTGHWIRFKEFENGYYHIKCSECGQYWSIDGHAKIFKHCFNCGARMVEEQERGDKE